MEAAALPIPLRQLAESARAVFTTQQAPCKTQSSHQPSFALECSPLFQLHKRIPRVPKTIFNTPVISPLMRNFSIRGLRWGGWHLKGQLPLGEKFVMIAAPHTSNWDLPVMLAVAFAFGIELSWMGKHTLFWGPLGMFFRWLGGIPIDRRATHDVVAQSVALFQHRERLILAVAPEGTRKKVRYWKTGFYHIACGAGVPILLGFIDYRRKETGVGPTVQPTGDLEADLKIIREFYAGITGLYEADTSPVAVRQATEN